MCADGQAQSLHVGVGYRFQMASREDKLLFSLEWEAEVSTGASKIPQEESS